ncbi:amidohydrolase family protein [Luteimonas sp. SJ-92]|uniref:Amidohydrolase family protein n=1 Tax=Luteimonas salinisoli TaxID=2752307 RepID=A0A853JCW3_9GAMM|nr:amidohydrolase family protein [Luteimonas salinisoli]NZA27126.1 amidohydrolase family protein [Luteimonas salinisoli]
MRVFRIGTAILMSLLIATACPASGSERPVAVVANDPGGGPGHVAFDHPLVALVGVLLVDGTGGAPVPNQTIVVAGDRIVAIGDSASTPVPDSAHRLDLHGHTVIPGIVGMHNHLHMPGVPLMRHTAPRLYLASGVTTIATAGSADADGEIALAAAVAEGEVPGPRIFQSAPYLTGPGGNAPMFKPGSPEQARDFVRQWAGRGAAWIKLYRHVRPDVAAAAIDQAHALGLRVAGHVCSLTFAEAARMGIDSLEHGLLAATDFVAGKHAGECVSNRASLSELDMDDERVAGLVALLVREGVTLTSTLAIGETHFPHRPQADGRALAAMSPELREAYRARQRRLREDDAGPYRPALFGKMLAFERMFVAAGGRLVAGPDTGRHVLPGFGDQRNFELLVEAGFDVPGAIRIMTANGAETLGIADRVGILRQGLQADLVVLAGDLVREPGAIARPVLVFKQGTAFDPAPLLEQVRGRVGGRARP